MGKRVTTLHGSPSSSVVSPSLPSIAVEQMPQADNSMVVVTTPRRMTSNTSIITSSRQRKENGQSLNQLRTDLSEKLRHSGKHHQKHQLYQLRQQQQQQKQKEEAFIRFSDQREFIARRIGQQQWSQYNHKKEALKGKKKKKPLYVKFKDLVNVSTKSMPSFILEFHSERHDDAVMRVAKDQGELRGAYVPPCEYRHRAEGGRKHRHAFRSKGKRLESNHDLRLRAAQGGLFATERKLQQYAKKHILWGMKKHKSTDHIATHSKPFQTRLPQTNSKWANQQLCFLAARKERLFAERLEREEQEKMQRRFRHRHHPPPQASSHHTSAGVVGRSGRTVKVSARKRHKKKGGQAAVTISPEGSSSSSSTLHSPVSPATAYPQHSSNGRRRPPRAAFVRHFARRRSRNHEMASGKRVITINESDHLDKQRSEAEIMRSKVEDPDLVWLPPMKSVRKKRKKRKKGERKMKGSRPYHTTDGSDDGLEGFRSRRGDLPHVMLRKRRLRERALAQNRRAIARELARDRAKDLEESSVGLPSGGRKDVGMVDRAEGGKGGLEEGNPKRQGISHQEQTRGAGGLMGRKKHAGVMGCEKTRHEKRGASCADTDVGGSIEAELTREIRKVLRQSVKKNATSPSVSTSKKHHHSKSKKRVVREKRRATRREGENSERERATQPLIQDQQGTHTAAMSPASLHQKSSNSSLSLSSSASSSALVVVGGGGDSSRPRSRTAQSPITVDLGSTTMRSSAIKLPSIHA